MTINLTTTITTTTITTTTITTTTTTTITTTTETPPPTTSLVPFTNASFYPSFDFIKPNLDNYTSLPICNFSVSDNNTSIYKVTVSQTLYPYHTIEENHGNDLYPGGHYIPKQCRSEQRLALIICYRNREEHLQLFLDHMHPFLKKQQLDYTIFVVNQNGNDPFNRATLFNVGFIEAMKLYPFDCFIFHDVDLLPEDLRNVYKCVNQPRHMYVFNEIIFIDFD
jgi:hypothetical protein